MIRRARGVGLGFDGNGSAGLAPGREFIAVGVRTGFPGTGQDGGKTPEGRTRANGLARPWRPHHSPPGWQRIGGMWS